MALKLIANNTLDVNTIFSEKTDSSTQPIDELNVAGNVLIQTANPDTLVVSTHGNAPLNFNTVNNFQEMKNAVALATSTPVAKEVTAVDNSVHVMTQHECNLTVQEIASHLSGLDDTTLVHLQEMIAQQRLRKEGINNCRQAELNTFFPVGTIACNYVNSNSVSDCDEKPDISLTASNEQGFDIPDSMVAYIYKNSPVMG